MELQLTAYQLRKMCKRSDTAYFYRLETSYALLRSQVILISFSDDPIQLVSFLFM